VVPIGDFSGEAPYLFNSSQSNVLVPATGGNDFAAKLSSCTQTQEAPEEKSFNSRIQVYSNIVFKCYNVFSVPGSDGIVVENGAVVAVDLVLLSL